jgi:mannose-6-phosphate isomerase-like protein (cupin superfamily)
MPIFRSGDEPPAWCELRAFDIVSLAPGDVAEGRRRAEKERLLVTAGSVQLLLDSGSLVLREGQFHDLVGADSWRIRTFAPHARVVRLSGRWGNEIGGCGIFRTDNVEKPLDHGDPVSYPKTTAIDSHYHDCDEYWIFLEGSGTVVVGDRHLQTMTGDAVAIGMGHHHDLPLVTAPVKAVYFETTLGGEKRIGHLWNHTHGPAVPRPERI